MSNRALRSHRRRSPLSTTPHAFGCGGRKQDERVVRADDAALARVVIATLCALGSRLRTASAWLPAAADARFEVARVRITETGQQATSPS